MKRRRGAFLLAVSNLQRSHPFGLACLLWLCNVAVCVCSSNSVKLGLHNLYASSSWLDFKPSILLQKTSAMAHNGWFLKARRSLKKTSKRLNWMLGPSPVTSRYWSRLDFAVGSVWITFTSVCVHDCLWFCIDSVDPGLKMADLEAVLADVSYLMAMEKSKSTPAARASKKIILPEPR